MIQKGSIIEEGPGLISSIRDLPRYLTPTAVSYGTTAWLFAVTGPFLIYLNAAKQGNLSPEETNSWMFGIYFFGGVLTLLLTLHYRQPIPAATTIPGGVLVGTALTHLELSEVVGAYVLTGILITLLGVSGIVKRGMEWLPLPIMMAMVAGVLLPFGVGVVSSLGQTPLISSVTFLTFIAVAMMPPVAKRFPPVLGAIIVGLVAATLLGQANWQILSIQLASPVLVNPTFTIRAAAELVIPLALTVVAVHNAQGIGILLSAGYKPPISAFTTATGIGSILMGIFGGQSACIAGPMTAMTSNPAIGKQDGRYAAAVVTGLLWILFGLFAPVATVIGYILPSSLTNLLAGLALLGVLAACFNEAFSAKFRLGALFTFMITISGITLFNIGAPFWGLVGGVAISALLEPSDFKDILRLRTTAKEPAIAGSESTNDASFQGAR